MDAQAHSAPLVSAITPVYNGEKYLPECIESVLAQTYPHWEYVIVNNRSTDRTLEIAQEYAQRDGRIRIHNNTEFVGVIRNHNIGFGLMSGESKYCKLVQADDWLYPDCLAQMVRLAEARPTVGIVGAYALRNTRVMCDGLPASVSVVPGRELCRLTFFEKLYVFLSPTCHLIRADLIRDGQGAFYDEAHLYADVESCLGVLQRSDFGFVHQVLSFVRAHDESISMRHPERVNAYLANWLQMLRRYGPMCLTEDEYRQVLTRKLKEYDRFLAQNLFRLDDKAFWRFHVEARRAAGYPLRWLSVMKASMGEGFRIISYPVRAFARALAAAARPRGRASLR